jgi:hypothetical protein
MQGIQLAPQFGYVLFVYQRINKCVTVCSRQLLPVNDLLQQGVFVQQCFHLLEVFLHILGVMLFLIGIGHWVFPLNRALL